MVADVNNIPSMIKTPKCIFIHRNVVVCCVKNRKAIELIFQKIYRFDLPFWMLYIYGTVSSEIAILDSFSRFQIF